MGQSLCPFISNFSSIIFKEKLFNFPRRWSLMEVDHDRLKNLQEKNWRILISYTERFERWKINWKAFLRAPYKHNLRFKYFLLRSVGPV